MKPRVEPIRALAILALLALPSCGDPPSAVTVHDANPVPVDAPMLILDAAPDGAAPDAPPMPDASAGLPDATPDADADPGLCPGMGETCARCGTVVCTDGVPICSSQNTCPYFGQAYRMNWPAGVSNDYWGSGVAFGDLDDDGAVDALVGAPDGIHALRGDGMGGFTPWPTVMSSPSPMHISGLSLADHDGDDDLDLLITTQPPRPGTQLWANDGTGRMIDLSTTHDFPENSQPGGTAWGDYDGDGDLDVFIPGYFDVPSQLMRNDGNGFTDVAPALGLDDPPAATLQAHWFDYEDDGDLDLLVANDKGTATIRTNHLYRNEGNATFTEVSQQVGMTHQVNGMGLAVADFDRDGLEDIYITDIGWVDGGQLLYRNQGGGLFSQESHQRNVAGETTFGWGTEFLDLDNDGDLDLVVAATGRHRIYENVGDTFVDITSLIGGAPSLPQVGLASADFDADGRIDLAWWLYGPEPFGNGGLAYFARNLVDNGNHWVRVALRAPGPNTRGVGATIVVHIGQERWRRSITAGNSFNSASEPVAHFGLGARDTIDAIEVRWPDGVITTMPGPIAADQSLTINR